MSFSLYLATCIPYNAFLDVASLSASSLPDIHRLLAMAKCFPTTKFAPTWGSGGHFCIRKTSAKYLGIDDASRYLRFMAFEAGQNINSKMIQTLEAKRT